jgi:hypothetical protein
MRSTGHEPHGGAGIAEIERFGRGFEPVPSCAVDPQSRLADFIDRDAHRPDRRERREAVFPCQETANIRRTVRDGPEHERTMRDRLVAGYGNTAAL